MRSCWNASEGRSATQMFPRSSKPPVRTRRSGEYPCTSVYLTASGSHKESRVIG